MDTCARESGRPAPRVGLTQRDRPMVWHTNRFWGKKLIKKNLFFPLVAEKAETSNSQPLLVPREPSEFLLAAAGLLRRHPLAAPFQGASMQRTRALGYYFEDSKSSEKLCFHSQKTSHFEKQWWPPVLTTPNAFPHTMVLKQTTHWPRLLPSVCAVLCMDVQLTASSWGPSL